MTIAAATKGRGGPPWRWPDARRAAHQPPRTQGGDFARALLDWSHMRRAAVPLALALLALAALVLPRARGEVDRDTYRSSTWGVEMVVPPDWELSEQTSYPGILASAMFREGGGRLTLAAQVVAPGETARAYAERNRATLERLGYRVEPLSLHPTGAVVLKAETPTRARRLRQAYLVRDTRAFIVTLATRTDSTRSYDRAFDDTLRSIVVRRPSGEEDVRAPVDAGPGDGAPASAPSQ